MNAKDVAYKIRANLAELRRNREQEVKTIASDLVALIKIRIQGSGQNYLNTRFSPYTKDYAKQRAAKGAQISYVDFTRSGRLFASVYPETDNSAGVVTVEITAHGQDNIDKVRGAVKKRGNILRPSKEELQLAEQANQERVKKYLQI
jgi:predicted lipoprotein